MLIAHLSDPHLRFPGTLHQQQPGAEPAFFVEPPAFLLHHWRPGTGLVTHFVPIGTFRGPLPFVCGAYRAGSLRRAVAAFTMSGPAICGRLAIPSSLAAT